VVDLPLTIALGALGACALGRDRRRVRELRECARGRNLRFSRYDWLDVHRRHGSMALMRIGHAHRAWHTFYGLYRQGLLVGFFDAFDLGGGADRVTARRCAAILEIANDVAAVFLPKPLAQDKRSPVHTSLAVLGFAPAAPAATPARPANDSSPREPHALFVQKPSATGAPVVARLATAIARHPAEWLWEIGDRTLLVCSNGDNSPKTMAALLDAVVRTSDELAPDA
jgi:hypothetical protein